MKLYGHAAVFDSLSEDLGGFKEVIKRGAFAQSLRDDDVVFLRSHDSNLPMARTSAGNLRLSEDATGLKFEVDLPDLESARDLHGLVRNRSFKQMSFGFRIERASDEKWVQRSDGLIIRELLRIRLMEISAVVFPAYASSTVSARAMTGTTKKPSPAPHNTSAAYKRMKLKMAARPSLMT